MHWRYRLRKQQLLDECEVPPEVFQGGIERLAEFARPFADCLGRREQRDHARTDLAGLVSDLKHKTAESIAYRHGQQRHGLQHFVGSSTWEHRPLPRELAGQVGRAIGTPDGVIVFDPSGFAKKGQASAGARRPWLGRLGKVDNGQVGIHMAHASYHEPALVDVRLHLPQAWAQDRARRKRRGIPRAVRYRARHERALEMLQETGPPLPHGWVRVTDAPAETLPGVLARVAKAERRGERCLRRGKSEAGLAESQVRTWSGWHHHQALSRIAAWFLVREARRGKKGDARADSAAGPRWSGVAAAVGVPVRRTGACRP